MLTTERLREVLDYDPVTGIFIARVNLGGRMRARNVAGQIKTNGYRCIGIDGRRYLAHRLVWLYVHGRWPVDQIDHINRDPSDNSLANLREARPIDNRGNTGIRQDNASGYKGVSFCKNRRKWVAYLQIGHRNRNLGGFDTPEEAHLAYCEAAFRAFGEFARFA
jgi:hypothetical protein